ncbi:MAG TPA: hypothetical protein VHY91_02190 [Pirellulales bacterium]|jgi:hypothetical protein|nr:hypothetical protein [Pirellulales bacterium]
MMRAIAIKELRETIGIAAIAVALYVAIVTSAAGIDLFQNLADFAGVNLNGGGPIPFIGGEFLSRYQLISAGLAIALAVRQSSWETSRGTYLFLLHRPAPRQMFFAGKIATGLVLLQLTAAIPILAFSVWAATPGTHPSPFEWSMTLPSWRAWICLPMVYCAAFASGLLPGRWRGQRLLPLLAGLMLYFSGSELAWPLALVGSLLASVALLSVVGFEAQERDFG